MNKQDEEILIQYQIYKIRRNKKFIFVLVSLVLVALMGAGVLFTMAPKQQKLNSAPIIELQKTSITVQQDEEINYSSFIKKASDKEDGDLVKNVQFNEIDTSKVGTYTVTYYVVDNKKNKATAFLEVIVKEKEAEQEAIPPVEQPIVTPPVELTVPHQPPVEQPIVIPPPIPKPSNKDFLFSDGVTNMGNAMFVCEAYLGSYAGSCSELRDANGTVIGSRAVFN